MSAIADGDQLTILVIDDEPPMADLIATALLKQGHQVISVGSAEEGLEQLPHHAFQVAFIDHHLPRMEGLVLGGFLRRHNPDLHIALVTGEGDPTLRRETERLGITFVQKPFVLTDLYAVVARYQEAAAERAERRAHQEDPDFGPALQLHHRELAGIFELPGVPERIADALRWRVKEALHNLASEARYSERERVVALAGILAAEVLGVSLPRGKDGAAATEQYDQAMRANGRRAEFTPSAPRNA